MQVIRIFPAAQRSFPVCPAGDGQQHAAMLALCTATYAQHAWMGRMRSALLLTAQGEEGMGGLASRQMGYGDPPGQPSEEEPGSAGRRKRRPARSMSFDREPPRGPEPDGAGT
jgi:hypothetical protein